MGVQKTYGYATSKGVAGGIYDMFHYPVDSRFNEEATGKLHFGVGVVTGKVPGSGVAPVELYGVPAASGADGHAASTDDAKPTV